MNAEIRRTKARLAEEVPKLQRLALKKVWIALHLCFFLVLVGIWIHCYIISLGIVECAPEIHCEVLFLLILNK